MPGPVVPAAATTTSPSKTSGLEVYPRLVAAEHRKTFIDNCLQELNIKEIDVLLGGGVEAGSSVFDPGTGRYQASRCSFYSTSRSAVKRGEVKVALMVPDEGAWPAIRPRGNPGYRSRCPGEHRQAQRPAGRCGRADAGSEFSPTWSAAGSTRENIKVVLIDSLQRLSAAMSEEQFITPHIHELLQYLNWRRAATFLVHRAERCLMGEMR